MAQRVYIPFTDSNPDCLIRYIVEYKAPTDVGFNRAPDVFASPAVVDGLTLGVNYTFKITKECCDGTLGTPTYTNYTPISSTMNIRTRVTAENAGGLRTSRYTLDIENPSQVIVNDFSLMPGEIESSTPYPLDNSTVTPITGSLVIQNNTVVDSEDFMVDIVVRDGSENIISGATIVSGQLIEAFSTTTISPFTYGDSPDGIYVLDVTEYVPV